MKQNLREWLVKFHNYVNKELTSLNNSLKQLEKLVRNKPTNDFNHKYLKDFKQQYLTDLNSFKKDVEDLVNSVESKTEIIKEEIDIEPIINSIIEFIQENHQKEVVKEIIKSEVTKEDFEDLKEQLETLKKTSGTVQTIVRRATQLDQLGDVDTTGVQNGQILTYNSTQKRWTGQDAPVTTPSGNDGEIQYNLSGSFSSSSTLKFDTNDSRFTIGNPTTTPAKLNLRISSSDENIAYVENANGTKIAKIYQENDQNSSGRKMTSLELIHEDNGAFKAKLDTRWGGPTLTLQSLTLSGGGSNILNLSGLNVYDGGTNKIQLRKLIRVGNHSADGVGISFSSGKNEFVVCDWSVNTTYKDFKCAKADITILNLREESSVTDPSEGNSRIYMDSSTGDLMVKITKGGVTKTATLVDFSAI